MTRAQALALVKSDFQEAADALGWTFAYAADEGRWATALDNALLDLGFAAGALATAVVPADREADFRALLTWRALEVVTRALALWVDIEADDPRTSKNYSQRYRAYQRLLNDAAEDVRRRGLAVAPGFEFGALTLDVYEPTEG